MPRVTVEVSVDEIKRLLFQLPPDQFLKVVEEVEERAETIEMMKGAESGFQEWEAEGENIYDADS